MARAPLHEQGLNGRHGDKVYYTVNGITYVRTYVVPDHSAPSELQTMGWDRFYLANQFVKPLTKIFRLGFINYQTGMRSPAKVGLSKFLKTAFKEGEPEPVPSLLQVSGGDLTGMSEGSVEWKDEKTVLVKWQNNAGEGNAANRDKVSVLLYDTVKIRSFHCTEGNPRSMEMQEIPVSNPDRYRGNLHAYAFFTFKNPRNGKYEVSRTVYLGKV
ncbi:hypothetical protein KIH41_15945 [Litoribacter ruber]|uniref:DUF6266 family protein n=1 Tax=Litoribacter ruber TaxID=702568 RepID=UPI001BD95490|nr:DUF6266 family protein [Litoribacter ruber]MBT0812779.1 hypothetical protein [Litoribacter ruber]